MGIFFHPQCECEASFAQHLKAALMSVKKVLRMKETEAPMELIRNILDNLNNSILHKVLHHPMFNPAKCMKDLVS